jgi:hypothetical protein
MMQDQKWRREKSWIVAQFNDSLVMLDVTGSGNYFGMNKTAAAIWDILDRPSTIDEIVDTLIRAFDVTTDQCRSSAERALAKLKEIGAVSEV